MTDTQTTENRATAIVMISVLARQLENWIRHAKDMRYAKSEFRYELTKTEMAV